MSVDTSILSFLYFILARHTVNALTDFRCTGYQSLDSAIYSTKLSCSQLNLSSTQLIPTIHDNHQFDNYPHSNSLFPCQIRTQCLRSIQINMMDFTLCFCRVHMYHETDTLCQGTLYRHFQCTHERHKFPSI